MKTIATSKHLRLGSAAGMSAFAHGFSGASIWCQINQPLQNSTPSMRLTTRGYEDCSSPGEGIA
jgi:predicted nicotinamide N-methyase